MADTSEVVNAGLDFSDAGQNRVVLADHDAGVVTAVPNHVAPGNISCTEKRQKRC